MRAVSVDLEHLLEVTLRTGRGALAELNHLAQAHSRGGEARVVPDGVHEFSRLLPTHGCGSCAASQRANGGSMRKCGAPGWSRGLAVGVVMVTLWRSRSSPRLGARRGTEVAANSRTGLHWGGAAWCCWNQGRESTAQRRTWRLSERVVQEEPGNWREGRRGDGVIGCFFWSSTTEAREARTPDVAPVCPHAFPRLSRPKKALPSTPFFTCLACSRCLSCRA